MFNHSGAVYALDLLTCTAEGECRQVADRIAAHYPLPGWRPTMPGYWEIGPSSAKIRRSGAGRHAVNVTATFMLKSSCAVTVIIEVRCRLAGLYVSHQALVVRGRAPTGAPYATSKFATEGMMQVLADEYQNRVLCVNPVITRAARAPKSAPAPSGRKIHRN